MASGLLGTAIGFLGVGLLPRPIALGLIFLNPLFFAILLAGAQGLSASTALLIGAPLGVLFHLIAPDLDLLITGVVGGTLAFLVGKMRQDRKKYHD
jgi:predicted branched-subunit amino acid permease